MKHMRITPNPASFLCLTLGTLLVLSALPAAAAPEFDVFGRHYSERNMIPAGTALCQLKRAVDVRPVFVEGVQPLYPFGNLLDSKGGTATVFYRVNEDGSTTVLSSETTGASSARQWFGNHAVMAVGSWLFKPAQRGGVPVAVDCAVTFDFAISR